MKTACPATNANNKWIIVMLVLKLVRAFAQVVNAHWILVIPIWIFVHIVAFIYLNIVQIAALTTIPLIIIVLNVVWQVKQCRQMESKMTDMQSNTFNQKISYRYAQGKQWALVDENNHNITEYVYDNISYLTEKLFKVCKKDRYGIIDSHGNLITEIKYDEIKKVDEHCIAVRIDKDWGLVNDKGDVILPIVYFNIYAMSYRLKEATYIQIWKNGKSGIVNNKGDIIIPIDNYDFVGGEIKELGLFKIEIKHHQNNRYLYTKEGYINYKNEIIIEPKYTCIYHLYDIYFIASKSFDKFGIIDIYQNEVLSFRFTGIQTAKNGLILAEYKGGYNSIKFPWLLLRMHQGNIKQIGGFFYKSMKMLNDNVIKIMDKDLYGLMDSEGNIILPIIYDYISSYDNVEPYFVIEKNGLRGLADKDGNICIPVQYELLRKVSSNLVRVKRNGKYGICDLQGNEVVPCIYEYLYNAKDDRIAVYKNGKWGFFDNKGNVVIDFIYDEVESFSHQVASVVKDGKRYFLDIQGNFITQEQYGKLKFNSVS